MRQRMFFVILISLLACGGLMNAAAQSEPTPTVTPTPVFDVDDINEDLSGQIVAEFIAENNAPRIGERVNLGVRVEIPPGAEIIQFPQFPAETDLFQVVGVSEISREETPDSIRYEQTLTLVLWQPGNHLTPEIVVGVRLANGQTAAAPVQSAFFNVPSLLALSPNQNLRPAPPPFDMDYVPLWWFLLAAAIMLSLGYGIYALIRRSAIGTVQALRGTPTQVAIADLRDLQAQQLPPTQVYPIVANRLRQYLESVFRVKAVEMTTAEVLHALRDSPMPDDLRTSLSRVLEQADLVKFAQFEPDSDAGTRLIRYAITWLRQAERVLTTMPDDDDAQ